MCWSRPEQEPLTKVIMVKKPNVHKDKNGLLLLVIWSDAPLSRTQCSRKDDWERQTNKLSVCATDEAVLMFKLL